MTGAVGATKDLVSGFYAMTNDTAVAVSTSRCEGLNGALEAVEHVVLVV